MVIKIVTKLAELNCLSKGGGFQRRHYAFIIVILYILYISLYVLLPLLKFRQLNRISGRVTFIQQRVHSNKLLKLFHKESLRLYSKRNVQVWDPLLTSPYLIVDSNSITNDDKCRGIFPQY